MALTECTSSRSHAPAGQNLCWCRRGINLQSLWKLHAGDLGAGYTLCAQVSYPHFVNMVRCYIDWLTVGKYISDSWHSPVLMLASLLLWQSCGVNLFSCQVSLKVFEWHRRPISQSPLERWRVSLSHTYRCKICSYSRYQWPLWKSDP